MQSAEFNPPPNWPVPHGWIPDDGWVPDSSWPPAPHGWQFWIDSEMPETASPLHSAEDDLFTEARQLPPDRHRRLVIDDFAATLATGVFPVNESNWF